MTELIFKKTKQGYTCTDRQGRSATGLTKDMARNAYFMKYEMNQHNQSVGFDMSQFNNKMNV